MSGCVTAKITSNKAEWYNKKLTRVFVIFNTAKENEIYATELARGIISEFKTNYTEGTYKVRNPLSLETDTDVDNKINEYNPDQLMVFRQTTINSANGVIVGGDFQIKIIDIDSDKIIWTGVIDAHSQIQLKYAVNRSLKKLSEQLSLDNLM